MIISFSTSVLTVGFYCGHIIFDLFMEDAEMVSNQILKLAVLNKKTED